jgi:hypothetical protein
MTLVKEIEKAIAQLPPYEASMLKYFLSEYEAVSQSKKLKAYKEANQILVNFKQSNCHSSWN